MKQQSLPQDTLDYLKDIVKIQMEKEEEFKNLEKNLNFKLSQLKESIKELKNNDNKLEELKKRVDELELTVNPMKDINLSNLIGGKSGNGGEIPIERLTNELEALKLLMNEINRKTDENSREISNKANDSNDTINNLHENLSKLIDEQEAEIEKKNSLLKNYLDDQLSKF